MHGSEHEICWHIKSPIYLSLVRWRYLRCGDFDDFSPSFPIDLSRYIVMHKHFKTFPYKCRNAQTYNVHTFLDKVVPSQSGNFFIVCKSVVRCHSQEKIFLIPPNRQLHMRVDFGIA